MIINYIKILLTFLMIIFVSYSFFYNVFYISIGNYFISTLTIKDYFFNENIQSSKGTHDDANIKHYTTRYKYKDLLKSFNFKKIYDEFYRLNNIDVSKSPYKLESEIIMHLLSISKESNSYKRNSLLYFSRDLDPYWKISCDVGMTSLLGPAISNVAVINGLPFYRNINNTINSYQKADGSWLHQKVKIDELHSCYSKFNDYGFGEYKTNNIFGQRKFFTSDELCIEAKSKNFYRVIEIDYDNIKDSIKKNIYICK